MFGERTQLSDSVKFGNPVKSLNVPKTVVSPDWGVKLRVRPLMVAPEGSLLLKVIVCEVVVPSACGGKVNSAGDIKMGCVQAVEFPSARHRLPESPGELAPGHFCELTE